MFTTFKEMEAYVLGQNLKKRIALANAHDEPALSAVVHAKRKGVVEGTLIGKAGRGQLCAGGGTADCPGRPGTSCRNNSAAAY